MVPAMRWGVPRYGMHYCGHMPATSCTPEQVAMGLPLFPKSWRADEWLQQNGLPVPPPAVQVDASVLPEDAPHDAVVPLNIILATSVGASELAVSALVV